MQMPVEFRPDAVRVADGGDRLHLLVVEDSESDVHLIAHLLKKAGYDAVIHQVQTADDMERALRDRRWEMIVSDFFLPKFDGLAALELRQRLAPEVPFVSLSGAVGEDRATALLRAGANAFVPKSEFPRLVQVIERELAQARARGERRREQQALQQERLRLKAILNGAIDGIVLLDTQGLMVSVNPAAEKIAGSRMQDLVGRPMGQLLAEDARDFLAECIPSDGADATQRCCVVNERREVTGRRANGESFPMDLALSSWGDGTQRYFICVIRDLTAQKQLQAQLNQAQKMEVLMQLSGGLAHDFNNLLGIVIGNLDLLAARLPGDEKSQSHLDAALRAALRGADITRRMLSLSRLQHDTERSRPTSDINTLVDEVVAILHRTLGPTYEITTTLWPDLPTIGIDRSEFENALLNLALNARDAMPDGGKLAMSTRLVAPDEVGFLGSAAAYILVKVSDTGEGMDPPVLDRAMQPFFTTKKGGGTGLGLSMVAGFVHAHKGQIRIDSERGYGTAVHLYLPVDALPKAVAQDAAPPAAELPRGAETILVVDDESELLELTRAHLGALGYRTLGASNGADALALLDAHPEIDLLLTDVVMPGGLLGTELAVNAQHRRPRLPVVLCSGFPKKISDDPRYARFSRDILAKPFRKSDLARAVRQKLDNPMDERTAEERRS